MTEQMSHMNLLSHGQRKTVTAEPPRNGQWEKKSFYNVEVIIRHDIYRTSHYIDVNATLYKRHVPIRMNL